MTDTTRQHSDKGLETLAKMNTIPTDWGRADIKWELRTMMAEVYVACPTCRADGYVYIHPKLGTLSAAQANEGGYAVTSASKREVCSTCPQVRFARKGRKYYSEEKGGIWREARDGHHGAAWMERYLWQNGLVLKTVKVEREVGIVQWAKGTRFDSRFQEWGCCDLCSKRIPSHRFAPVTGKGKDGVIHGMWIGLDCALKFFGIKNFKEGQVVVRPGGKP